MRESKYQVINWKRWKYTSELLKETKEDLQKNIKAVSYSNELPGENHKTMFQKYNKLIEQLEVYDQHIMMYDTVIKHLENSIATLLDKKQREVIIIYSNYRDSHDRIEEALKKGYSQATFFRIANEAFDILDTVLSIDDRNNLIII